MKYTHELFWISAYWTRSIINFHLRLIQVSLCRSHFNKLLYHYITGHRNEDATPETLALTDGLEFMRPVSYQHIDLLRPSARNFSSKGSLTM